MVWRQGVTDIICNRVCEVGNKFCFDSHISSCLYGGYVIHLQRRVNYLDKLEGGREDREPTVFEEPMFASQWPTSLTARWIEGTRRFCRKGLIFKLYLFPSLVCCQSNGTRAYLSWYSYSLVCLIWSSLAVYTSNHFLLLFCPQNLVPRDSL